MTAIDSHTMKLYVYGYYEVAHYHLDSDHSQISNSIVAVAQKTLSSGGGFLFALSTNMSLQAVCLALPKYTKHAHHYPATFNYRFNRRFDLRKLVTEFIVEVARCRPFKENVIRAYDEARLQSGQMMVARCVIRYPMVEPLWPHALI